MNRVKNKTGGRPPINDPAINCCKVRFNSVEYLKFLALYEKSGLKNKASFIKARVFNESFKVIKVDRTLLDYYQKLSKLYTQYRGVANNYNQVVVALKSNFTEKKALAFLYKLENITVEMIKLNRDIINLTEDFKRKWSQKSM